MSNPKSASFTSIKQDVFLSILAEIFRPYQDYLEKFLDNIIKENAEVVSHSNAMWGFNYKHKLYRISQGKQMTTQLPKLASVLEEKVDSYLESVRLYAKDYRKVSQGLSVLFSRGETMQDLYDLLPEEVHSILGANLVNHFGNLTRTRPEAYAVKDNPVQYEAFLLQKELIFQYIGNHLIV